MFFKSRKQAKIEEENRKKEQQRLEEENAQKEHEFQMALEENQQILFGRICHMVRSLPKERQVVVVQRKNIFKDKHDRNKCYLKMAYHMSREHRLYGKKWISGYDDSLYAFYKPTIYTFGLIEPLYKFSEGGYRIQRIRYYREQF